MTTPDHIRAHRHSCRHLAEIEASALCGCFYCLTIFGPADITVWVEKDFQKVGQTALCPRCGIDSVIGSESGYPITVDFLSMMKNYWFQPG